MKTVRNISPVAKERVLNQEYEEETKEEAEESGDPEAYNDGLETGFDLGFAEGFLAGHEKGLAQAELRMRERFHFHIETLKKKARR